jgi:hypothetical protein
LAAPVAFPGDTLRCSPLRHIDTSKNLFAGFVRRFNHVPIPWQRLPRLDGINKSNPKQ